MNITNENPLGTPLTEEQIKLRDLVYKIFTCVWLSSADAYILFLGWEENLFLISLFASFILTGIVYLEAFTFSRWRWIREAAIPHLNTLCEIHPEAGKYRKEVFNLNRPFTEGEYRKIYSFSIKMSYQEEQTKKDKIKKSLYGF